MEVFSFSIGQLVNMGRVWQWCRQWDSKHVFALVWEPGSPHT